MTAKSIHHKFVLAIPDRNDPRIVRPSNWNDDHDFWMGFRRVTDPTDTITNADHMSLVLYEHPVEVDALIDVTGGVFPLGWYARLLNRGGRPVTITGTGGATIDGQPTVFLEAGNALDLHGVGTSSCIGVPLAPPKPPPLPIAFGGYFSFVNATRLQFVPIGGNYIRLSGDVREIPVAGIAGLGNTNVRVDGVANQNLVPETIYLVFVTDINGVLTADYRSTPNMPADMHRASTTPGNEGTEVLYAGGSLIDALSLIGMCMTDASAQFVDSPTQRLVLSWFNRRSMIGQAAFTQDRIVNSAVVGIGLNEIDPEIRVHFLTWANEQVMLSMSGASYNIGGGWHSYSQLGARRDLSQPFSIADAVDAYSAGASAAAAWQVNISATGALGGTIPLVEGRYVATIMGAVNGNWGAWIGRAERGQRCSLMTLTRG